MLLFPLEYVTDKEEERERDLFFSFFTTLLWMQNCTKEENKANT